MLIINVNLYFEIHSLILFGAICQQSAPKLLISKQFTGRVEGSVIQISIDHAMNYGGSLD
jgi:hypothetical protein